MSRGVKCLGSYNRRKSAEAGRRDSSSLLPRSRAKIDFPLNSVHRAHDTREGLQTGSRRIVMRRSARQPRGGQATTAESLPPHGTPRTSRIALPLFELQLHNHTLTIVFPHFVALPLASPRSRRRSSRARGYAPTTRGKDAQRARGRNLQRFGGPHRGCDGCEHFVRRGGACAVLFARLSVRPPERSR